MLDSFQRISFINKKTACESIFTSGAKEHATLDTIIYEIGMKNSTSGLKQVFSFVSPSPPGRTWYEIPTINLRRWHFGLTFR